MKNFRCFKIFFLWICLLSAGLAKADEQYIEVNKKGVLHKFVIGDAKTNHFTGNVFANWENETFDIFDLVKNDQTIAIDIGAWIGTTGIWLAKNFHHVLAIEADRVSLDYLKRNLEASDCVNVTICDKPISDCNKDVIFGPRGPVLNESISYVKDAVDSPYDYILRSLTFKQILFDYIYSNPELANHDISFIKCDIEGGEENILEDVLHFAYNNNCQVYMSFHLTWWQSRTLEEFEYLFKYFDINCPIEDVSYFIHQVPFCSLLFTPKKDAGVLIKKNIPMVIMGYNQYTYIKNMVEQLEKYSSDIIVIDNDSNFSPLLDYYEKDFKYTLLKQKANYGHTVYLRKHIQKITGDLYVLTDPDLRLNEELPDDFLKNLVEISTYYGSEKTGFALNIEKDDLREDLFFMGHTIKEWESQFWVAPINYPLQPKMVLYSAPIDTTFCLVNRKNHGAHIRVAGQYTCLHLPWHKNFQQALVEGEYEYYLQNNRSSNWFKAENRN